MTGILLASCMFKWTTMSMSWVSRGSAYKIDATDPVITYSIFAASSGRANSLSRSCCCMKKVFPHHGFDFFIGQFRVQRFHAGPLQLPCGRPQRKELFPAPAGRHRPENFMLPPLGLEHVFGFVNHYRPSMI